MLYVTLNSISKGQFLTSGVRPVAGRLGPGLVGYVDSDFAADLDK
jgi:hypothetical protein